MAMKTSYSLLLVSLTALIITFSCQKSNNGEPNNPDDKPVVIVTAGISGRVVDDNNLPVNGAVVKAGTASVTTDINGNFKISDVSLNKNAGFIKVEKDGFFPGSRTIVVNEGATNNVSIQLIKKTVSGTVSSSTGGKVTVASGGSINFLGNSFINTGNNAAYTGTVSVSAFFINPAASNFREIMPGTLRGINASNQETGLQSFGMMAVELTGAGGEKLQLGAGKTATLTFPVPAALQASAPATIPLWSFNDTTGLWKEEGTATLQGTNYVGTVSHFSFWNCDYPYALVDFKAVIKDQNGNPFNLAHVTLKTINDTLSTFGTGVTDINGLVSGKIPSGKTLQLKIYNKCNTLLYNQNIGPFTTTANLGTITLNNAGSAQLTISGTVMNCYNTAVTNGFVDIALDNTRNRAIITNGNFSLTYTRCSNAPANAVITAYDMDKNENGPATSVAVTSGTATAGQLSACGTTVSQFVNYKLDTTNYSFASPADSIIMYKVTGGYMIWSIRKNNANRDEAYIKFNAAGTGVVPLDFIQVRVNSSYYTQQGPANVNITEFGAVGGFVSGNLSATVTDTAAKKTVPVTYNFRVKRAQ
jgi:hypothetical protein